MELKTEIKFDVVDASEQEILITAQGDEILLFEENAAHAKTVDPDAILPEVVEVFVRAANLGMLGGVSHFPWQSKAEVLNKAIDLEQKVQTWKVALHNVDKSAFRILLNLLQARNFNRIVMQTLEPPLVSSNFSVKLNPDDLHYPLYFKPIPFRLDIETPEQPSKDRSIQISFLKEPDDQLVNNIYLAFETWTDLLLLGGFPDTDTSPRKAGAFPDLTYLHDAFTIEQAFDIFISDEAAFYAIINYAQCLHHHGHEITEVRIR